RVETPEVADPWQRDRDEPVKELIHARPAQSDTRADGHALADLELRDRLARAPDLGALARDRRQLSDRSVERLRVGLRLADAHVERDLLQTRDVHDGRQAELLLQPCAQLLLVHDLHSRLVVRRGAGVALALTGLLADFADAGRWHPRSIDRKSVV